MVLLLCVIFSLPILLCEVNKQWTACHGVIYIPLILLSIQTTWNNVENNNDVSPNQNYVYSIASRLATNEWARRCPALCNGSVSTQYAISRTLEI